ncbi:MAG: hypothetical protein ACR2RV_07750, partial [Verrucomicrobiales bacterium]
MDEASGTRTSQIPSRRLLALAVGFGLFHALTLVLAILPHDWAINRLLSPYRQLTGSDQEWGMFYTIPTMQENSMEIDVVDGSGETSVRGPILPGLKPYRTHAKIRYYYLLNSLTDAGQPYLGAYVKQLGEAVAEDSGGRASEFSIRMDRRYIRLLERI